MSPSVKFLNVLKEEKVKGGVIGPPQGAPVPVSGLTGHVFILFSSFYFYLKTTPFFSKLRP